MSKLQASSTEKGTRRNAVHYATLNFPHSVDRQIRVGLAFSFFPIAQMKNDPDNKRAELQSLLNPRGCHGLPVQEPAPSFFLKLPCATGNSRAQSKQANES